MEYMDETHRRLLERVRGREAELLDPKRRKALIVQLAVELHIHPAFLEGFMDALDDPASTSFETRKTLELQPPASS